MNNETAIHNMPLMQCEATISKKGDGYYMIANTGAPMLLMGYDDPVIVDMDDVEFGGESVPVIFRHSTYMPLGATTLHKALRVGETCQIGSQTFEGPAIVSQFHFTNSTPETLRVRENLDNGFPYQVSIGAQPLAIEYVTSGQTADVNATTVTGAINISRKTLIKEMSILVFGADRFTKTFRAHHKGVDTMLTEQQTSQFSAWLSAQHISEDGLDDKVKPLLIAQWQTTQTKSNPPKQDLNTPTPPPPQLPITAEETQRRLGIETIASAIAGVGTVGDIELDGGIIFRSIQAAEDYAKKTPSVSTDAFKLAMINAQRKRPVGPVAPAMHMQDDTITSEVMECAILRSVQSEAKIPLEAKATKDGTDRYGMEAWFDDKTLSKADRPGVRHPSLGTIYATLIKQVKGYNETINPRSDDFWQCAAESYSLQRMGAANPIYAAGASPISLDTVWLNVASKILLSTSQSVPTTYQQWVKTIPVQDFKPCTLLSVDLDGTLSPVGNNGVLDHGTMSDASFTVQTKTFGKIYGITRTERINDDINAYLGKFVQIGLLCPKTIEQLAYLVLLGDVATNFTTARGNYLYGTDYAMSIDAYQKVIKHYKDRVGQDHLPRSIVPDRVITGSTLLTKATNLYAKDSIDVTYETGNSDEVRKVKVDNDVAGKLRPIDSNGYLDNTLIHQTIFKDRDRVFPNQLASQYFVTGNPDSPEGAAFYLPCLHGNPNPHVEQFDFQAGMLGTGVQVYADVNVVPGNVDLMTRVVGQAVT